MSSIVSRWVVLQRHEVGAGDLDARGVVRDDAVERWIDDARAAYLERCAVLRDTCERHGLVIQARDRDRPHRAALGAPASVTVSAGATEVFPTSFTMAFRLRGYGRPTTSSSTSRARCRSRIPRRARRASSAARSGTS